MPAVSKSQQRLMGMVHAYNKGELGDVSPELKNKIKQIAKSMKKKDAKDFAQTPHEDLPKRVKKKKVKKSEFINDMVKIANHFNSIGLDEEADLIDQLLQNFMRD